MTLPRKALSVFLLAVLAPVAIPGSAEAASACAKVPKKPHAIMMVQKGGVRLGTPAHRHGGITGRNARIATVVDSPGVTYEVPRPYGARKTRYFAAKAPICLVKNLKGDREQVSLKGLRSSVGNGNQGPFGLVLQQGKIVKLFELNLAS